MVKVQVDGIFRGFFEPKRRKGSSFGRLFFWGGPRTTSPSDIASPLKTKTSVEIFASLAALRYILIPNDSPEDSH